MFRHAMSLSLRRAWIEIALPGYARDESISRSPYGERGLKFEDAHGDGVRAGRSPYGERGLK